MPERDAVAEHIVKMNAAAAARSNPLVSKPPTTERDVAGEDAVWRFIRRRNASGAARPTPLLGR